MNTAPETQRGERSSPAEAHRMTWGFRGSDLLTNSPRLALMKCITQWFVYVNHGCFLLQNLYGNTLHLNIIDDLYQ